MPAVFVYRGHAANNLAVCLGFLPGGWCQALLPSPWEGDPHLPQEEAFFQLEEAQRPVFWGVPAAGDEQVPRRWGKLHLLLRLVGGCGAVSARKANIARSILYSFLDRLLLNHSIFVLITRSFLSVIFTTSPFHFPPSWHTMAHFLTHQAFPSSVCKPLAFPPQPC